jgi:hypothetical protein
MKIKKGNIVAFIILTIVLGISAITLHNEGSYPGVVVLLSALTILAAGITVMAILKVKKDGE